MFHEALDRAALASGVAAFEQHDNALAGLLGPPLDLQQFNLQRRLALFVGAVADLGIVGIFPALEGADGRLAILGAAGAEERCLVAHRIVVGVVLRRRLPHVRDRGKDGLFRLGASHGRIRLLHIRTGSRETVWHIRARAATGISPTAPWTRRRRRTKYSVMESMPPVLARQRPPRREPSAINAPAVVVWLIGVTVLTHLFLTFAPRSLSGPAAVYLAFNPADLSFFADHPLIVGSRWFGYALMHDGGLHLIVNCGFLLAFGTPIARQVPVPSFLALYALGAAGGALAVALVHREQELYLMGASGAVSALVGALSRMVLLRRGREMIPYPFSNRRAGTTFILVFVGINLVIGYLPGPGGASVSGESHLGGFITGFLLSMLLPWKARGRRGMPVND